MDQQLDPALWVFQPLYHKRVVNAVPTTIATINPRATPKMIPVAHSDELNTMHAKAIINHTILEGINEFHFGARD